jgi:hypothetical protein
MTVPCREYFHTVTLGTIMLYRDMADLQKQRKKEGFTPLFFVVCCCFAAFATAGFAPGEIAAK